MGGKDPPKKFETAIVTSRQQATRYIVHKTYSSIHSSPSPHIYRMSLSIEKRTEIITRLAKLATDRAVRAFCINPENKHDAQCIDLAREDMVHFEQLQRLQERDAAFLEGCKATPYRSACMQRVGLPPVWQMIYDFCGWVCGLIWGIGRWLSSIGPFSWALIILGIILFFICVGAVVDDEPRRSSRRGRGWGPHLD